MQAIVPREASTVHVAQVVSESWRSAATWVLVTSTSTLVPELRGIRWLSRTIDWRVDQLRMRGIANVTPNTPAHGQGVPVLLHMYTNRV